MIPGSRGSWGWCRDQHGASEQQSGLRAAGPRPEITQAALQPDWFGLPAPARGTVRGGLGRDPSEPSSCSWDVLCLGCRFPVTPSQASVVCGAVTAGASASCPLRTDPHSPRCTMEAGELCFPGGLSCCRLQPAAPWVPRPHNTQNDLGILERCPKTPLNNQDSFKGLLHKERRKQGTEGGETSGRELMNSSKQVKAVTAGLLTACDRHHGAQWGTVGVVRCSGVSGVLWVP